MSRIVIIVHGSDLSEPSAGPNRIITLAKSLHDHGYDVHLVIPRLKGRVHEEIRDLKIHIVPMKVKGTIDKIPRAYLVLDKAKKLAKKYNSILQIEMSALGGFAAFSGMSNFVLDMNDIAFDSLVYTSLPLSFLIKNFIYKLEEKGVRNAKKIIVVSNRMKNFLLKNWNVPEEKIEIIPNGYHSAIIEKINRESEHEENILAYTGSLFKSLNIEFIINLAKSLIDKDVKIYLIGDGELRPYVEKIIYRENLKNIAITGWLPYEKAMKLTKKAKITFVAVKRTLETEVACPVKILDYAALGKAMVLSDVSELSELLKRKKGALVSNPENQNEFIDNVHKLLDDKKLRDKLGKNAREIVKDFTWEKQGQRLAKIYENLK